MKRKWSVEERRAEIMRILESRRRETMANFAFYFGVSTRTIGYDIEILTVLHPIETQRGRGGCVKLSDEYKMYQNILSEEQQETLIAIIPFINGQQAKVIQGLLISFGSKPNKQRFDGLIR